MDTVKLWSTKRCYGIPWSALQDCVVLASDLTFLSQLRAIWQYSKSESTCFTHCSTAVSLSKMTNGKLLWKLQTLIETLVLFFLTLEFYYKHCPPGI